MGLGKTDAAVSRISPARAIWIGLLTKRADQAGFADGPRISTPKAPGRWTDAWCLTGRASGFGLVHQAAAGFLMGLVGFAALLALPLQAQAQTEVWSATLTPRTTFSGTPVPLGCDNTSTGNRICSNSNTLSADDFTDDGTTYAVTKFFTKNGVLTFRLDTGATAATQGLTLVVDSEEFVLEEADQINGAKTQWKWNNTTLGWTEGTDVDVALVVIDAPATGQPTISGAAQVSKTLTAATDDIEDPNGLPATPTFSYQWVRVDGLTDTDIPGATSETYAPTASDLGKQIQVKVSFTDARGHAEGPLTSDAYPANGTVVALPGPCPAVNDWCATMTAAVDGGSHGYEFDKFGSINDNEIEYGGISTGVWTVFVMPQPFRGLPSIYFGSDPQVPRGTVITLGELTYTTDMESADGVHGDQWEFPENGFPPDLVWSDGQEVRVSLVLGNFPAEGEVTISGTAKVGRTLTAITTDLYDIDGPASPAYTYQWVRVDGATRTDIAAATGSSYTLVATDEGKQVEVRVGFTDDQGHIETVTSEATVAVAASSAAGVTVSKSTLTVTEQDIAGASYTVVLDTLPTATVTVTVAGHSGTSVTAAPASLTFTTTNWNTPQTVGLTAANDANTVHETVSLIHSASSTDTDYDGITIAGVTVTVNDNDAVEVTIATSQTSVVYREGSASFTLTRTGPTAAALTVPVTLTQDRSFLTTGNLSKQVTFSAGSSTAVLTIPTSQFQDFPLGEVVASGTLTATVVAGTGYDVGRPAWASVPIVVALTVGFEFDAYTIAEASGPLQPKLVAITGEGAPKPTSPIYYSVSSQMTRPAEAKSPEDYDAVSVVTEVPVANFVAHGTVYKAEVPVDFGIVSDAEDEDDEAFEIVVELTPGLSTKYKNAVNEAGESCGGIGNCVSTITILDDDPTPVATLVLTAESITENGGMSEVKATLDRPSSETTTIEISAAAVSPAVAGDFTVSANTTLSIPAGEIVSEIGNTVTLTAVDNAVFAGNKSVTISGTATNDMAIVQPQNQTLTIEDDEIGTSTDWTLSRLVLRNASDDSFVAPSPSFLSTTRSYTALVVNAETMVTVEPTVNDSGATVEYLDASDAALTDADSLKPGFQAALTAGQNTIKVKVTAANRVATGTYRVVVTRAMPGSTDATLSALALKDASDDSAVPLTPSFATAQLDYLAAVAVTSVTVEPTGTDSNATFEYLDASNTALADADTNKTGFQAALTVGFNTIKVKVTAEDGATTRVYTVSVTRADTISTDATLSALVLKNAADDIAIALSPAFDTARLDYVADVDNDVTSVTVEPTQSDSGVVLIGYRNASDAVLTDADTNKTGFQTTLAVGENTIKVTVTAEDTLTIETYTVVVTRAAPPGTATGAPSIMGTPQVGQMLTAGLGTIADTDGLPATFPDDYNFQWVRVDADGVSNETPIGADAVTYTPVAADVGKKIKVEVSFTDDGGSAESLTSDAFPSGGMITDTDGNNPATGTVTISGTARKGLMLTADVSDISDPDGLTNAVFAYQWVRVDGTTETDIPGATAASYTPVADDVGKQVKIRVSFTDDGAHLEAVTSEAYPSSGSIGDSTIRSLSETFAQLTVQRAEDIGDPVRASGTYSLGGEDADKFTISSSSGQLRTKVGERYDYEEKTTYSVTVNSVNQQGMSVSILVIINILDVVERPTQPGTPTVSATAGSITSLDVSWTAPENTGRPPITHYNVRYREDSVETWTDGPQNVTGTEAPITGLTVDTPYQVQVQAVNHEGSVWSGYGEGRTDAPTVSFGASSYTAIEGVQEVTVTVKLFPAASQGVTILLTATPQGGATAEDWSGVPESITFAADETSKTFTMMAESDSFDETGESVQLGFGTLPSGINLGSPSTARVALVEDTGVSTWFLFFEKSSYTATEGGAAARVTVGLSSPWKPELNKPLTVGIFAPEHRGGADASDYSGVPERVTFQQGQTRVSFTVTATNDSDDDDGESIYLEFTGPDMEDLELGRGPRAATVHLRDNDGAIAVQAFFDQQTYQGDEGSTVTVSVQLDRAPGRELSIPITTAHGNGASFADYSGVPGSIDFSGSQSTRTFNVQVRSDNVDEDQEYLTFGFGELPASVSAGERATATLNLVDTGDESSVRTVYFDAQDSNVRELLEGSTYSLYVYLDREADNDIVVPLEVELLDGAEAADYSGVPETVIIRKGARRENVIIRVLEDTEDDHGEGIQVSIGSLPRGVSKNPRADTATFRFLDNDTVPAISIAGAYVKEWPNPQSYLRFAASLDYAPEFEVAVDYRTVDGTAVAGQDYDFASGTLTFAEGERSKYIEVRVCHDGIDESTETMTLQLSNPVRVELQDNGSATGTIGNNNGSGAKPCATGISVSDVSYLEPNMNHLRRQEMEFEVSLNQADTGTVTVDYETVDGTAKAGEDYESASGTVRFRPGQTRKTVKVVVVADAHDDPGETFTLRLSNPSGAYIGDGEGTATLTNSGLMPGSWITRFGRVAGEQAVQSIGERVREGTRPRSENRFTLGGGGLGRLLPGGDGTPAERGTARGGLWDDGLGGGFEDIGAEDGGLLENLDTDDRYAEGLTEDGAMDDGAEGADGQALSLDGLQPLSPQNFLSPAMPAGSATWRLPDIREMFMGASFDYSRAPDGEGGKAGWLGDWSAWGRTAATRFSGADGPLSLTGEVTTATLGADSAWGRWIGGVALSYSAGQGSYSQRDTAGGTVESSLTSLIPYASYSISERTSVWGALGYGVGGMTLTPGGASSGIETGLSSAMAAFGGRGALNARVAGIRLAWVSDALITETASEKVIGLNGASGGTQRVRLMLEGTGAVNLAGGMLRPRVEAGLRYDGGDAETGAGLEVGAGLAYAAGRLAVQVAARGLVTHQDSAYKEWGLSSSLVYRPGEENRGLSMQLGSTWGNTQSGVRALWSRADAAGLAPNAPMNAQRRLQAELGYGILGAAAGELWLPFFRAESAAGSQALVLGVRFTTGPNINAGLEIGQRSSVGGPAERAVQLQGTVRW